MSLPLYHPHDEKDRAARVGIQIHQKAITSLDAKIASLLDVIVTLQDLKRDHQDQLRRCESVLALAGRLPPEMLGHIFESCVDAYPSAPLVLSQVCAAWRMAAHNMPRVWSRIFVNCSEHRSAEKAAHWLSMSGGYLPLHITLVAHNASPFPVMRVLLSHTSRWATLIVNAEQPFASEVLEILRADACTLWKLETVDFTVHGELGDNLDFRAIFDHIKCPGLHTIHLVNTSWHSVTFPSHISVLNLVIPPTWISPRFASQIIDLLRALPNLELFSLLCSDGSVLHDNIVPVGDTVTATVPRLHTFILTGFPQIFDVLGHLTLPALRHLSLRMTGKEFPQKKGLGPDLLRMTELSLSLKTLELYDIDAPDEDLTRCFNNLSDLEELYLHESEVSDAVFRRFCFPSPNGESSNSWICPKLRRLDLRWCSQLSGSVLVELVNARSAAPETSRISEVVVINCSCVREEDVFSLATRTICRLNNRPEDFCHHLGCCKNNRYRHRLMLRRAVELRQQHNGEGRLEL